MLVAVVVVVVVNAQWLKIAGREWTRLWEIGPFLFCRSGKAHPAQV